MHVSRLAGMAVLLLILWWAPAKGVQAATAKQDIPLWTTGDTLLTGTLLAGTVALMLGDESIRDEIQDHRHGGLDTLADGLDVLGHPLTLVGVSGGLWAWGRWQKDQYLAGTGHLAVAAILSAEAGTLGIKAASGRQRPDDQAEADSFHPFAPGGNHDSFPSAHTAGAFALAAVLARRCDHPLAPWLSYGGAGLVGLSRVYRDDHWASDVVLGALVGEVSGRLTLRWHARKEMAARVVPVSGGGVLQVGWTW